MEWISYLVGGLGILGGLLGTLCTVLIPVLLLAGLGYYIHKRNQKSTEYRKAAQSWPATSGTILSATIQTRRSGRSISVSPVVIYSYNVSGREYQSQIIKAGEQFLNVGGSIIANQVIQRYPVGSNVTVYYNPQNPGEAALER